jgi:acetyl-CoA carboxylase biotin carboxyl carrier protein
MALTYKEVAEIIKLIDASDCVELILELDGARLVVRRDGAGEAAVERRPSAAPTPGETLTEEAGEEAGEEPADDAPAGTQVRAPMVGTLYRKPSPEAPPFVELGARVAAGDPLALIEVMKLFNTIEAPCAGVVRAIAVEDVSPVEYDQLLFVIAPD